MRKKDGQTYVAGSAIVLGIPREVVITAEALAKKLSMSNLAE
jgi:predicted phosphoribosyltransferase